MAPVCGRAQYFPALAECLRDSVQWRGQLRAAAWRQRDWYPGFRDSDLLSRPRFIRTRSRGVALLYGEPALMVAAGDARGLLYRLDQHQRAIEAPWVQSSADETAVIARLGRDLRRLIELGAIPPPRLVFVAPKPENDDGRADQARPSRSSLNLTQAWPPGSGRRMTPCERL